MVFMMVQGLKSGVPKTLRANVSCWVLGSFGSKGVIADLYEEVAGQMSEETFDALYAAATSGEHDQLVIDFSQPRAYRYSISFKEYLLTR